MRKLLYSLPALCLWLGIAGTGSAQTDVKPLSVVSFAGYEKLSADADAIGRLMGNPNMAQMLDMMIQMATQGKGLAGVDPKRPWGAAVLTDGRPPLTVYGFIPVTDLKQFMEVVKSSPAGEFLQSKDGVYAIQVGGKSLFIGPKDDWAVATKEEKHLADAPDPLKLFGDLPKRYDLAVQLLLQNAPEELRQQILANIRAGEELAAARLPGESDAEYNGRMIGFKASTEAGIKLIQEAAQLLAGLSIDSGTGGVQLDLEMTARSGTELAERFQSLKPAPTRYAGLAGDNAAAAVSVTRVLSDQDANAAKNALAAARMILASDMQNRGLAQTDPIFQAVGVLFDVLEKTVAAKKIDGGAALHFDSSGAVAVVGGTVVGAADLEKTVVQLVEKLRRENAASAESIALNIGTHEGVRFHTLTIPPPDEKLIPLLGQTLEVVLGFGDDQVWAAAGRDARKALEQAIDRSKAALGKEVNPLRVSLAAGPLAKLVGQLALDEEVAAIAGELADLIENGDVAGKDHLTLNVVPIPEGVRLQLRAEEGLLKAVLVLGTKLKSAPGKPPAFGPRNIAPK